MSGRRVENLAEHYLGDLKFSEASPRQKNRFLDEVCRRYVRDANKLYYKEGSYVLMHESDDFAYPSRVKLSVYSMTPFEFRHSYTNVDGVLKKSRVSPDGLVSVVSAFKPVISVEFKYAVSGFLDSFTVTANANNTSEIVYTLLITGVDNIRYEGISYDLEGFLKHITSEEVKELKSICSSAVSSLMNDSVVSRFRKIVGDDVVLEPINKTVGTIKAIENKD